MVHDVPPGVPGPFSVYLVDSLPNPDLSFFTLPRVCAPADSEHQQFGVCCTIQTNQGKVFKGLEGFKLAARSYVQLYVAFAVLTVNSRHARREVQVLQILMKMQGRLACMFCLH